MAAPRKQLQESLTAANGKVRIYEKVLQILTNRGHGESIQRAMREAADWVTMGNTTVQMDQVAARIYRTHPAMSTDSARHVFNHLDQYAAETVNDAVKILREAGELPPEQPEPRFYLDAEMFPDDEGRTTVLSCPDCGALVWSTDTHDAWHGRTS